MSTKIVDYFRTAQVELKKVVWPTKKETTNYSLAVIGVSIGIAIFFGILDVIFNWGLEKLISLR